MTKIRLAAIAALLAAACAAETPQANKTANESTAPLPPTAETEAYIRKSAEEWAAGDAKAMAIFLADDYSGVASSGEIRDKAMQLQIAAEPSPYSGSRVDYVNFRHFDDVIIAQGAETLTRADGGPDRRLIWTDVWMYRNERWQVVASQDSVRPPQE